MRNIISFSYMEYPAANFKLSWKYDVPKRVAIGVGTGLGTLGAIKGTQYVLANREERKKLKKKFKDPKYVTEQVVSTVAPAIGGAVGGSAAESSIGEALDVAKEKDPKAKKKS